MPSPTEIDLHTQLSQLKQRIIGKIQQGPYSKTRRYGLNRDLSQPLDRPAAKIPISVRPLAEADLDVLLPLDGGGSPAENQEIAWRRAFYQKVPHGCFVAVDTRSNTPCYMQWLLGAEDNETLARFKCFPPLARDEALLEQAYTPPSHRGLRIMPAAMAEIAERALDFGARYVLTFVEEKNVASLKGCWRAGFQPHLMHRRVQAGFGTWIRNDFEKLAENDPRRCLPF